MTLPSPLLSTISGVRHAFGTLSDPIDAAIFPDWAEKKPNWKQVHGVAVADAMGPLAQCGEVDAIYTFVANLPIAVVSADCVPILLARRDGQGVAAVHSGWRGTRAKILEELWARLATQGERASDWVAAIGPAIGPCCYEVSEELALGFTREFGVVAVPHFRHLDLPAINEKILHGVGIGEVETLRECTQCTRDANGDWKYHSFRREGGGTRQYSMIGRN